MLFWDVFPMNYVWHVFFVAWFGPRIRNLALDIAPTHGALVTNVQRRWFLLKLCQGQSLINKNPTKFGGRCFQLLPVVTEIDHPNGGHVFTPERATNKTPKKVTNGRTWLLVFFFKPPNHSKSNKVCIPEHGEGIVTQTFEKLECGHFSKQSVGKYSFSHNHRSGKWLYLKRNYYWRDSYLMSMLWKEG